MHLKLIKSLKKFLSKSFSQSESLKQTFSFANSVKSFLKYFFHFKNFCNNTIIQIKADSRVDDLTMLELFSP